MFKQCKAAKSNPRIRKLNRVGCCKCDAKGCECSACNSSTAAPAELTAKCKNCSKTAIPQCEGYCTQCFVAQVNAPAANSEEDSKCYIMWFSSPPREKCMQFTRNQRKSKSFDKHLRPPVTTGWISDGQRSPLQLSLFYRLLWGTNSSRLFKLTSQSFVVPWKSCSNTSIIPRKFK